MRTVAVVAGVGRYKQETRFPALDCSVSDARWIRRFLRGRGVAQADVRLLLNEAATRDGILRSIRRWPAEILRQRIRFLFFFLGHGCEVREPGQPPVSVLLTHDADAEDRLATGLPLADMIKALRRLSVMEAYVFIDACHQELPTVENPLTSQLPDDDVLATAAHRRSFFCMVAAGRNEALENVSRRRGYFTGAVLSEFARLASQGNATIANLAACVTASLEARGLPSPAAYLLGNSNCWPLPSLDTAPMATARPVADVLTVNRKATVAMLSARLASVFPTALVVHGESGLGKTVCLQQLVDGTPDAVYVSFLHQDSDPREVMDRISTAIAETEPGVFPSGRPGESAEGTFHEVAKALGGFVVVLDHAERASNSLVAQVVAVLLAHGIQSVLGARPSFVPQFDCERLACPAFAADEIAELKTLLGNETVSVSEAIIQSAGNALLLRRILTGVTDNDDPDVIPAALMRCARRVSASSGLIDLELFSEVCNVAVDDLQELERRGLLRASEEGWLPHDKLSEATGAPTPEDQQRATEYWARQVLVTRMLTLPARMLALSILRQRSMTGLADSALPLALEELWRAREVRIVDDIETLICEQNIGADATTLKLLELRVEQGVDAALLSERVRRVAPDRIEYLLLSARRGWWAGNYDLTASLCDQVFANNPTPAQRAVACLEKGIAKFFVGQWQEATQFFQDANASIAATPRTTAWARLMLGTVLGLRGVDVPRGRRLLESSIRLLGQLDDWIGLGVANGNLGEVCWKSGDLEAADACLARGVQAAQRAHNATNELEVLRNQLHVAMKKRGPGAPETRRILGRIHELSGAAIGGMERMQIVNTLATYHAYIGDVSGMEALLASATALTAGNIEYEIYTLGNQALWHALRGELPQGIKCVQRSVRLARQGDNRLAVVQIADDVDFIARSFPNEATRALAQRMRDLKEGNNECDSQRRRRDGPRRRSGLE